MTSINESGNFTISDLDSVFGSFLETIEIESNKLREKAERDSSNIIAEAKEKAKQTIEQAEQVAKSESDRIVAKAKQESAEVVRNIKEKIYSVVTEVVGNTIIKIKDDLTSSTSGILSDGKNKERDDSRLFKGRLKVEIAYPFFTAQPPGMQEELSEVPGLKILSMDSYARGNSQILGYMIELEKPMPLLETIKKKVHAKHVAEYQRNILVIAE